MGDEMAADGGGKEAMEEADEALDDVEMDAGDEGEETAVTAEVVLELVEGAEAFFGLGDELFVALEGPESHRIVDMEDGNVMLMEHFP